MADGLIMSLVSGELYTFKTLTEYLKEAKGQYFKVRQELPTGTFNAIMVMMPYNNGIGIAFDGPLLIYSDGDVCTADSGDKFYLTSIQTI